MITDLGAYPAYKDSGLPWLDVVPEHWDVKRGKNIFCCIDVRSDTGLEELLTVSSKQGIIPRRSATVTMFKAESYVGHKLCWPGDLVINSLWAWARGLGVSQFHGIISTAYGVYRPRPGADLDPGFIHKLVRSTAFLWELRVRSKGVWTSRLQLTDESFLCASFLLPPLPEQTAIVRFLDYVDRRIQRYIRAKQKLIKLLEEQKQAIIHRAVTRGLDPDVRLEPSGVEWLGEVPEHWEVRRLKNLVTQSVAGPYGSSLTKAMYVSSGFRVYGQQQVIPDDFTVGDYYITPEKFVELKRYRVFPRDVLVSVMGTVGRVAVVPENAEAGIINPRLVRYRPDFRVVLARYLQLVIQSPVAQVQLTESAKGTTMEGLNMEILGRLLLPVPPIDQQATILTAVDHETEQVRSLSTIAQSEVTLLREYRTRLIADVVTGKLDVREAASRLPQESDRSDLSDTSDESELDAGGEDNLAGEASAEETS